MAAKYIQYFAKKDFSGTGTTGSPSGVSGGGIRNSGNGGRRGNLISTVVLRLAILLAKESNGVDVFNFFGHAPLCGVGATK